MCSRAGSLIGNEIDLRVDVRAADSRLKVGILLSGLCL